MRNRSLVQAFGRESGGFDRWSVGTTGVAVCWFRLAAPAGASG
jgi:hypothetical protein